MAAPSARMIDSRRESGAATAQSRTVAVLPAPPQRLHVALIDAPSLVNVLCNQPLPATPGWQQPV